MLILTRRPNEAIMIGNDVVVTVLRVNGNHVSLGIKAPTRTPIWREEVLERMKTEEGCGVSS